MYTSEICTLSLTSDTRVSCCGSAVHHRACSCLGWSHALQEHEVARFAISSCCWAVPGSSKPVFIPKVTKLSLRWTLVIAYASKGINTFACCACFAFKGLQVWRQFAYIVFFTEFCKTGLWRLNWWLWRGEKKNLEKLGRMLRNGSCEFFKGPHSSAAVGFRTVFGKKNKQKTAWRKAMWTMQYKMG